ncbi:ABC transporter ATP-binding protein [Campylobacter sp. RM12327]|uniref:ABC transporter ATP-binding protein n=1 Tax=Campylobacter sputorum TaxID=206 RepID=UPI000B788BB3|nr:MULTISPECIES: ABC transporter ATP-binding protein [Campylobacter]ASM39612.1 molybdenum ABC transporter ModABC, ATP-binding protein [Campylobacter sputorum]MBE7358312.1 ABC transporter ATP-binding protein [Campylobacter sp. RM11302]MBF6669474.1 ABC transporter ATP-binding protein [Campylobacter sp. RM12327]MBF6674783.1 ABC transporter ATP-binding protein [Campylobacter sp. RM13538]MBF6676609.1 ABC transporter ATP-binding protein [Campylobacter sp. RM12321]
MIEIAIKKPLYQDIFLDVNLQIQDKTFLAISGASGSGKTTFLRCLAGLEKCSGIIKINGEIWQDGKTFLKPQNRKIGFVFQDYALFENLSVEKNFLFVEKDYKLCDKLLDMLDLKKHKDRHPSKLSGGQKQRVALGRAMMRKPILLLLDEPLSALDPSLRLKLQDEILKIHNEFGTTTMLVSHSPSEIYKLATFIIEMSNGHIIKNGTPKEVLLKQNGSQKFSFMGTILDIQKVDAIFVVTLSIGQQITQVAIDSDEGLKIGEDVNINTKAFNLNLSKI